MLIRFVDNIIQFFELNRQIDEILKNRSSNLQASITSNQDQNLLSFENDLKSKKIGLILIIGELNGSFGLIVEKLRNRVHNLRSYSRSKFSQEIVTHELEFECINVTTNWIVVNNVFNLLSKEESSFAPFNFDDVMEIPKIFKDDDLVIIRFCDVYDTFFSKEKDNSSARKANTTHLKNIMLRTMPVIFLTNGEEEYVIDITKFEYHSEEILKTFAYLIHGKSDDEHERIHDQGNLSDPTQIIVSSESKEPEFDPFALLLKKHGR